MWTALHSSVLHFFCHFVSHSEALALLGKKIKTKNIEGDKPHLTEEVWSFLSCVCFQLLSSLEKKINKNKHKNSPFLNFASKIVRQTISFSYKLQAEAADRFPKGRDSMNRIFENRLDRQQKEQQNNQCCGRRCMRGLSEISSDAATRIALDVGLIHLQ